MNLETLFQSPRSGKFESNVKIIELLVLILRSFQSPRSGKFESNLPLMILPKRSLKDVSIP